MRAPAAPIYRAGAGRFRIDSCEAQSAAVRGGKIQMHALSKGHYPGQLLSPRQLPGINSIGFWDGAIHQDWGLEAHRNEGVEITYLETGDMPFSVEEQQFKLRPGHFTITRPWQLHKLGAPNIGPGRLHWLILDVGLRRPNQEWRWPRWLTMTPEDKAELTCKLRQNENPVWNASPDIASAFRDLSAGVLAWPQPHLESRMLTLLNQLLLGILTALSEQQSRHDPELTSRRRTVELFLRGLAENAAKLSQPWALDAMAAHCGMGVTSFSKYCRELVNSGPMEYLHICRLDYAARQLSQRPSLSITDIAFRSGFNSSQYFATAFRKRFQATPRGYRRHHANVQYSSPQEIRRRLPEGLRPWRHGNQNRQAGARRA